MCCAAVPDHNGGLRQPVELAKKRGHVKTEPIHWIIVSRARRQSGAGEMATNTEGACTQSPESLCKPAARRAREGKRVGCLCCRQRARKRPMAQQSRREPLATRTHYHLCGSKESALRQATQIKRHKSNWLKLARCTNSHNRAGHKELASKQTNEFVPAVRLYG